MREGRKIETFKTGSKFITITRGTEGPREDPYAYEEISLVPNDIRNAKKGGEIVLHMGLGMWVKFGDLRLDESDVNSSTRIITAFEEKLGCTLRAFHKAVGRIHTVCRVCGGGPDKDVKGYPGETFTLCTNGHIIHTDFDESAIL